MHIEKLKSIQECLASAAETQVYDLENVDAQELGEVIDIIKDIEETIYYCTVTKAMKEGVENHEPEVMYYGGYRKEHPSWREKEVEDKTWDNNTIYMEKEYPHAFEDPREGKSYRSRRMYMESKESKQDKTIQMRELEKYLQELAQDITEMIEDASAEERQYLSKKISSLATKVAT
jgi:hypothetical protein